MEKSFSGGNSEKFTIRHAIPQNQALAKAGKESCAAVKYNCAHRAAWYNIRENGRVLWQDIGLIRLIGRFLRNCKRTAG
ncbi:hypothetical protein [Tropicibacter sp. S64]|uniref:hypothetical protein n=1 Tax=Tropicibacter sp. S64 TaxID=3415122 RepID=UPI003C7D3DB6